MKPIRRQQLIDAAIASIHEHGFSSATVARIARKAGVSTGIVHHYFTDKNDLLAATMRALLDILRREAVERMRVAEDAARAHLCDHPCLLSAMSSSPRRCSAPGSRSMAMRVTPTTLQRILRIYHRRLHSNLSLQSRAADRARARARTWRSASAP